MALCAELDKRGYHITIETNATLFASVAAHLISMSPKLRNSNPPTGNRFFKRHERGRLRPDVIREFLDKYPCQVKFVVETPEDLAEIQALQMQIDIPAEAILLMPQGRHLPCYNRNRNGWLISVKRTGIATRRVCT